MKPTRRASLFPGPACLLCFLTGLPESRLVITEAGWPTVASEFGPRADEAKQ